MRELRVAKSAGFCFGVSRSVELAEKLLEEKGACYSFGELIHNRELVRSLESRGMSVVNSPEELKAGDNVIIRAHGVSRDIVAQIEKTGAAITDATCP